MGLACRLSALGLLLSALLVCTRSQDQESVFAIVGEDFTFSPKVNGTISEITWMKRKNKVAEWERDKSPTYFSSLAERGKLETSSGNLTIKKLNTDDAAEYEAQVLPVGDDLLQYTKFVLEVLDPPSPSVLNCSVTNGQIRISCEIHFSKDVRYSWYRDDRKIIQASNPVLELKENADRREKVLCVREVSKTKINNSISLSACFPKSAESLSRDRNGLIAFFVILLLFMGALFVLWKRGLLSNILRQRSRKNSAAHKPEEQHLTDDDRFPEESGQKEDEARNLEEIEQGVRNESQDEARNLEEIEQGVQASHHSVNESRDEARKLLQTEQDVRASHNSVNESQDEKGSHKKDGNLIYTWMKKIRGNIWVRSDQTHKTGPATAVLDSGNNNVAGAASEEKKNSKETESMSQADDSSNQENPEEKKNSKETMSMSQADSSSNQEKTEEKKNSKETMSMSQADSSSNQEKTDLKLQSEAD